MAVLEAKLSHLKGRADASQGLMHAVETRMQKLIGQASVPPGAIEPTAQQAAAYHLASGGQRIRAQLAIHAGLALKLHEADAVSIAAACELLHNASLIHDDLQDRDLFRHGAKTVWSAYGDGVAICAGDLLLSAAYCALAGFSRPRLLPTLLPMLHNRISDASTGQCADLACEKNRIFSLQDYEKLAALKSGSLLALPIELALAAAGQLPAVPLARRAAESFAVGYQVFDDLNDVQKDLARTTAHPAVNVVAVMQAVHPGGDARLLARQLAVAHLDMVAQSSLALPFQSGQLLGQFAHDLSAQVSLDAA